MVRYVNYKTIPRKVTKVNIRLNICRKVFLNSDFDLFPSKNLKVLKEI
jgi:hypothetical protein